MISKFGMGGATIFKVLFLIVIVLIPCSSDAAIYWVHPSDKSASWNEAGCQSASDPGAGKYCSLSTANSSLVAGDTVYLKGGSYNVADDRIVPSNSGTLANRISYVAASGETPEFIRTSSNNSAISITGKDYIVVDGVKGTDLSVWLRIANGADYNEIKNCVFIGSSVYDHCIRIYDGGGGTASTHNWLHNNTFGNCGGVVDCSDEKSTLKIDDAAGYTNGVSDNNTIESNLFYGGGHDVTETFTKRNVISKNVFHNEGWMSAEGCDWGPSPRNSKYGNRNFQIYDSRNNAGMFNLVEGNKSGHAAFASDGAMDGNIVITSPKNIVRYNSSYYSETFGLYFKAGSGSYGNNNRAYNNSLYYNGQDSQTYPNEWTGYGDQNWRYSIGFHNSTSDNILKNNIVYNGHSGNFFGNGTYTESNNWITASGDPLFIAPIVSDPTSQSLPDLSLQSDSPTIDGGTYLTLANGAGNNTDTLVVDDALYFQDGSWGSALAGHQPDWIAIGTVGNVVEISSIDYAENTITLAAAKTWADDAPIWLYKKSDGEVVLLGSAPDYGAYEFSAYPTMLGITAVGVSINQ